MKPKTEKWDDGCKTHNVRNQFVIPKLVELIDKFKPSRILDIGTGTGYIARSVDESVNVELHWTLIDMDAERINFTESNMPASVNFNTSLIDFTKNEIESGPFDFVLLLFTLLELNLNLELFSKVSKLTSDGGLVVIAMPDSLEDVLKAATTDPSLLTNFVDGRCILGKVDKFTGEHYPFKAHRFEYIVQLMLYSSFSLDRMYSYKNDGKETFMLVFKKNGDLE